MLKRKILIADDNVDILDAIQMVLQIDNYDVVIVKEGGKIISKIKDSNPDVLILDLWMSGVNGIDICNKIRKNNGMKNLPIILISASNELKKHASNAKFNDIIEKPFDMSELLSKVAQQIDRQVAQ